jgi:fumarate hydratase subunit alpha
MPKIEKDLIEKTVKKLTVKAATELPEDCYHLLKKSREHESHEGAKEFLDIILKSSEISKRNKQPLCQSPGIPCAYIKIGTETRIEGNIYEAVVGAVRSATKESLMRPSIIHPLTRINTGDNTGPYVPHIDIDLIPGEEYIEIAIAQKGSEMANSTKRLYPADVGLEGGGVKAFVLRTVLEGGGIPCPPTFVSVGIGGTMDLCCKISRLALLTPMNKPNPDKELSELEEELLQRINKLGIGPMGLGGDTTSLAVKVTMAYTHTAYLRVAVNVHCWALRKAAARIYPDGNVRSLY